MLLDLLSDYCAPKELTSKFKKNTVTRKMPNLSTILTLLEKLDAAAPTERKSVKQNQSSMRPHHDIPIPWKQSNKHDSEMSSRHSSVGEAFVWLPGLTR